MQSQSFAARAGRWSAQHRKKAILGWFAFVILATVLGGMVGTKTLADEDTGNGESRRGDQIIEAAGFPDETGETVLVQGRGDLKVGDPRFTAAVEDVIAELEQTAGVSGIENPFDEQFAGNVSDDGRSVLVNFELPGDEDAAKEAVEAPLATVAALQKQHPEVLLGQFGDASAEKEIGEAFEEDFQKAEFLSLPITLVILLIAFGALVAAGLPLLLGATAVMGTIGLLGPISQLHPLEESSSSVVLLVGLAVGVDYCMFYLRREMEERDAGRGPEAALEAAAATSGRAVLVSGLTVMSAMAGMFLAGNAVFVSFGIGTIIVVAVAMLGSVSVLPAMLSFLSRKGWTEKGRVPWVAKRRHKTRGESRVWAAILDRVLKRPLVSAIVAGGLLVALTIPAFSMHTLNPGITGLPRDLDVMQAYDRIDAAFPGGSVPAVTVVKADDVTAPEVRAAIADLQQRAIASGQLDEPTSVDVSPDKTVATVALAVKGTGTDAASERSLAVLREDVVPATVAKLQGAEVAVTGFTAGSKDFNDVMRSHLPIVFAFVLTLAFILLLVTFRSVVIPIKAIVLNLLSVGAAYGVLKLVFQDGRLEGLLDYESVGGITSWLPLFLFVILFGLSMDYHVFILSRIREAVDGGMSTDRAVAHGIKSTAGVVTSAAAVMIAVFAIFATLSMLEFKQMGVGLAVAVLIDATIVRAVLLPATMKLLGDWNWYLPKRLHWLPKFEHEPQMEPSKA
ncbi:MAG TPA: MMPL family transporter [Solirubrobacteraceae bacterium]|jgi:RND superfamily putative drug exporter|nr:MMPL family transporter [Solirubrobacteraceae bacterium]